MKRFTGTGRVLDYNPNPSRTIPLKPETDRTERCLRLPEKVSNRHTCKVSELEIVPIQFQGNRGSLKSRLSKPYWREKSV